MHEAKSYFFCGVGGSGMLPLALIVKAQGHAVAGSDRALDQGRLGAKFDYLAREGVALFAQDGSGLTRAEQILVVSGAVEETIADVVAARRLGAIILTRAELLASLFNAAQTSIAIGGTSGKSTTTAMLGWILERVGLAPTIMNGAVMKNFATPEAPFASARIGAGDLFVAEVDESDGSIARYVPRIAVINNIALDHKTMDELRRLFADFAGRAETAILNLDNAETASIVRALPAGKARTFGLENADADLCAMGVAAHAEGVSCTLVERKSGARARLDLRVIGRHNIANALAAISAALACGVGLADAAAALSAFAGVSRRLEFIGAAKGVTVIDDFAHNPDKITASLAALHEYAGRLIVFFQPHGFGPLKLMKTELIEAFVRGLAGQDMLLMTEPVYYGGTTDRSISSIDIVEGVRAGGREARLCESREACAEALIASARAGERIVVMGARDDTLTLFAKALVERL